MAEKIPFEPDLDHTSVGSGNIISKFLMGHIPKIEGLAFFI